MKILMSGFGILLLCFVATTHCTYANDKSWEYKDWNVSTHDKFVRYMTNGDTVHGHQFGLIKMNEKCNTDLLWISWSSYEEDGIEAFKGSDAIIELRIGDKQIQIEVPILSVYNFTPSLKVIGFSNFIAGEKLISLLKKERRIEVSIVAPKELVAKLDVTTDTFSLNGFVATMLKAEEYCKAQYQRGKPTESTTKLNKSEWTINESEGKVNLLYGNMTVDSMLQNKTMGIYASLYPTQYGDHPRVSIAFRTIGGEGVSKFSMEEIHDENRDHTKLQLRRIGMRPMKLNDKWIKMDIHGALGDTTGTLYMPFTQGDLNELLCCFINSTEVHFNGATFTTKGFTKTFQEYNRMLSYTTIMVNYCKDPSGKWIIEELKKEYSQGD